MTQSVLIVTKFNTISHTNTFLFSSFACLSFDLPTTSIQYYILDLILLQKISYGAYLKNKVIQFN